MSLSKFSGVLVVEPYIVPLESITLNGIVVILNVLYVGAGIMRFSQRIKNENQH
jgi:hypothetical protein